MKTVAVTFMTGSDVSKCIKTQHENLWMWWTSPWRRQPPSEHLHGLLCLPARVNTTSSFFMNEGLPIRPHPHPPSTPFRTLPCSSTLLHSCCRRLFRVSYLNWSAHVCDARLRWFRKRIKRKKRTNKVNSSSFIFGVCGGEVFHRGVFHLHSFVEVKQQNIDFATLDSASGKFGLFRFNLLDRFFILASAVYYSCFL